MLHFVVLWSDLRGPVSQFLANFSESFCFGRTSKLLNFQLSEQTLYTLLAIYMQDKLHKNLERRLSILECHSWLSGFEPKDIFGSHRLLQQKVQWNPFGLAVFLNIVTIGRKI